MKLTPFVAMIGSMLFTFVVMCAVLYHIHYHLDGKQDKFVPVLPERSYMVHWHNDTTYCSGKMHIDTHVDSVYLSGRH